MIRRVLITGLVAGLLVGVPAAAQDAKPQYTVAEYNAYQSCVNDANAASKLKCFDTFQTTYPQSTLLPFVYQGGLQAAAASRNNPKIIEYADKVIGMGDKADTLSRFQAYYLRALTIHQVFNPRAANANEMATTARKMAEDALALIPEVKKPEQLEQAAFDQQITGAKTLFNYTIGVMSQNLKDFRRAADAFGAALVTNPGDALTRYQLGVSYMQLEPPQFMDGFWSIARAIGLKVAGEAQVRNYLRNQLIRYQGGRVQCDKEIDAQMNELIALAAANPEKPADYSIPSAAEIEAVQKDINILTLLKGLAAGGRTSQITWLATCGLEFPEVQGKVISAEDNGSGVVINVFIGQTEEEFQAATTANVQAKVPEQPEAVRVKKDEPVKFSGHVAAFTPEPFLLTFDKAKVDPEFIPAEEAATKKATPKKAPAKKAPTKRPPAR